MDQRKRHSPARFLAPLALIVVLIAFLAIVSGGGGGSSSSSSTDTTTSTQSAQTTTRTSSKKSAKKTTPAKKTSARKTYTIQVGDTLGGIANKTGISLDRIQTLNPNVDPHNLVLGQKIKLQ